MPILIIFALALLVPCWIAINGSQKMQRLCGVFFAISTVFYIIMTAVNLNNISMIYFMGMTMLSVILAGIFINGIKKKDIVNK